MSFDFDMAAYWSNREESAEQCADRLVRFFAELAACDGCLATWREPLASKRAPLQLADVASREYLLHLLNANRQRHNELGYQLDFWSDADDEDDTIGLSISCGGSSRWVANSVVVDFADDLGPLANYQRMSAVLAAVARTWEPTWAEVMSYPAREMRSFQPENPFVDWMIYLSRDLLHDGTVIKWPGRVTTLGGRLGAIISTQDEPPDPTNPDHVRNIESVRQALGL